MQNAPLPVTRPSYVENIAHNIAQYCDARRTASAYIIETRRAIEDCDGRKRSLLETLERRLAQAVAHEEQLRAKVLALETLETHASEIEEIDRQISVLCAQRRALTDNDSLHSYVKMKCYGIA